ncbi:MAG: DUF92 domain-containing protein [Fidelibacterota bacterium]
MKLPLYHPFSNEWITFCAFFMAIFLLIGITGFIRSRLKWNPEASRKMVHVIIGLMTTTCPFIFTSNIQPMTLAIIFIVVNAFTLNSNQFKSMHATERTTYGTVYFPFAFLLLVTFWWEKPITLVLSMLVMTISDTVASYTGKHEKLPLKFRLWRDEKSLQGSVVMFLSTFLIIYIGTDFFTWLFGSAFYLPLDVLIGCAAFTGLAASIAEAAACKGSDNFSVPLFTAITYDIFLTNYTHGTLPILLFWTLGSGFAFFFCYKWSVLNAGGSAGAFIMGVVIFGSGGVQWITPILSFFIFSSILSKIGKKSTDSIQKGSKRDIVQVFANGGVPMVIALVNYYDPFYFAYLSFLGAVAAATADTWATEIGFFSRRKPRHIMNLKPVKKGTSGGVTLLGFLGALSGAGVIALIGGYWLNSVAITSEQLSTACYWVVVAGFMGSLFDSILGGSVQSMFRCVVCNHETEKRIHCQSPTHHLRGFQWLDNDGVNFANTIVGVLVILVFS